MCPAPLTPKAGIVVGPPGGFRNSPGRRAEVAAGRLPREGPETQAERATLPDAERPADGPGASRTVPLGTPGAAAGSRGGFRKDGGSGDASLLRPVLVSWYCPRERLPQWHRRTPLLSQTATEGYGFFHCPETAGSRCICSLARSLTHSAFAQPPPGAGDSEGPGKAGPGGGSSGLTGPGPGWALSWSHRPGC